MGTAGGCGDCWKPRRVAGDALSILIAIFPLNSNKPRPHTESCILLLLLLLLLLKKVSSAKLRESDIYTISVRRPQPHNTNL